MRVLLLKIKELFKYNLMRTYTINAEPSSDLKVRLNEVSVKQLSLEEMRILFLNTEIVAISDSEAILCFAIYMQSITDWEKISANVN